MLIIVLSIVLLFFGSILGVMVASETSILMLTPGRALRLIDSGAKGAEKLDELIDVRHRLRAMTIILAAISSGTAALGSVMFIFKEYRIINWEITLISFGIMVAVNLLFVMIFQAIPRAFAVTNPEFIALKTAPLALKLTKLFGPLTVLLSAPAKGIIAASGAEQKVTLWAVTPEWKAESEEDTQAEEEQEAILEAMSDFGEKIAREVMTPRTDMYALEDTAGFSEAVELITKQGVSRIPIYHESIDDIRGILYSKDLLRVVANQNSVTAAQDSHKILDLARPAIFVPETKPVRDLMIEMRTHTHMVIVADEYGGTSGLVTLEDLLEEIVGDISDEFDFETPEISKLGEDVYLLDGRLSVDELNDLYDTVFDLDADSVGGLFIELVGHIPKAGEQVEVEGIKLVVTSMDGNRIERLRSAPANLRVQSENEAE